MKRFYVLFSAAIIIVAIVSVIVIEKNKKNNLQLLTEEINRAEEELVALQLSSMAYESDFRLYLELDNYILAENALAKKAEITPRISYLEKRWLDLQKKIKEEKSRLFLKELDKPFETVTVSPGEEPPERIEIINEP